MKDSHLYKFYMAHAESCTFGVSIVKTLHGHRVVFGVFRKITTLLLLVVTVGEVGLGPGRGAITHTQNEVWDIAAAPPPENNFLEV